MGLVAMIISILTVFSSSKAQPTLHGGYFHLIIYTVNLVDTGMCKIGCSKGFWDNESSQVV